MAHTTPSMQSSSRHHGELIFAGPDVLRSTRTAPTIPPLAKGGETR